MQERLFRPSKADKRSIESRHAYGAYAQRMIVGSVCLRWRRAGGREQCAAEHRKEIALLASDDVIEQCRQDAQHLACPGYFFIRTAFERNPGK